MDFRFLRFLLCAAVPLISYAQDLLTGFDTGNDVAESSVTGEDSSMKRKQTASEDIKTGSAAEETTSAVNSGKPYQEKINRIKEIVAKEFRKGKKRRDILQAVAAVYDINVTETPESRQIKEKYRLQIPKLEEKELSQLRNQLQQRADGLFIPYKKSTRINISYTKGSVQLYAKGPFYGMHGGIVRVGNISIPISCIAESERYKFSMQLSLERRKKYVDMEIKRAVEAREREYQALLERHEDEWKPLQNYICAGKHWVSTTEFVYKLYQKEKAEAERQEQARREEQRRREEEARRQAYERWKKDVIDNGKLVNIKNLGTDEHVIFFLGKFSHLQRSYPDFRISTGRGIDSEFFSELTMLKNYAQANKAGYQMRTHIRIIMESLIFVHGNLENSMTFYNLYLQYRSILGNEHPRIQSALQQSNQAIQNAERNWIRASNSLRQLKR